MTIKMGPIGLGSVKDSISTLEHYHKLGFTCCEIAFTYGVYIKKKEDAIAIGKKAKELGISLSIHGQYWINLNSKEKEKIEASKQRILKCLEVGTLLGAKNVVFHAGFYSRVKGLSKSENLQHSNDRISPSGSPCLKKHDLMDREKTYENIHDAIIELEKIRKEKKFTPKISPEVMGKINVFGSLEEIARLVTDTGCSFCLDFAHVLSRYKRYEFALAKKLFSKEKSWHVHFSGIEYTEKGERRHLETDIEDWKKLLSNLPKNKKISIICESPAPVKDAIAGMKILSEGKK